MKYEIFFLILSKFWIVLILSIKNFLLPNFIDQYNISKSNSMQQPYHSLHLFTMMSKNVAVILINKL